MIDPVSAALIAAVKAGATSGLTDVSKKALVDAYNALKTAIQNRFGQRHDLIQAIKQVEAKPNEKGRQITLESEVKDAEANQYAELVTFANKVLELLKDQAKTNQTVQQTITGNYNATSVHGDASVTVQPARDV